MEPKISMKKQGLNFSRSAFVEMNKKPSTEVEAGEEAAVFLNQCLLCQFRVSGLLVLRNLIKIGSLETVML